MRILVTGGAGFIGSHVAGAYLDAGHEVLVVDDLSTGKLENVPKRADLAEVDIRSERFAKLLREFQPECVNHHAAQMSVNISMQRPMFDADVNIVASLRLLLESVELGVRRFIYISTGGAAVGEPEYLPVDERHPVHPLSFYGVSKHTVEHYLEIISREKNLSSVALRYPNVYGPRQDPQGEAGVVAIFLGRMLANEQVVINGDGHQERDFVFVGDIAAANLMSLEQGAGVISLGSGRGTSVNTIFQVLADLTGYSRPARFGPALQGEVYKICLSGAEAERQLGWRAETALEEGLAKTAEWQRTSGAR